MSCEKVFKGGSENPCRPVVSYETADCEYLCYCSNINVRRSFNDGGKGMAGMTEERFVISLSH